MATLKFGRQDGRWGRIRGNWATLLLPVNDNDSIDFARLADEVDAGTVDDAWLAAVESADNLFPTLDYRVFA